MRFRNVGLRMLFRNADLLAPRLAGRIARDLWFTAPPRMADLAVPPGGASFEVHAQGHAVRGRVWEEQSGSSEPPRSVYLMHGWGGRGSQFGAMVEPLVQSGYRVVMLDAPAHGDSDPGPVGPRRTNGVEFAKALDAVYCRFGPAEAVVAHSLGTIATYLAMRFGWLGTKRLVLIAPMVQSQSLFDQFQAALGFGKRTRRAFDRSLYDWVGIPVAEFDARFQAAQVDPVPTLVLTDRGDRQTPHADVVDLATSIGAPLVTTEGLGHRKILRDPDVVARVVDFIAGRRRGRRAPFDRVSEWRRLTP
ncbi:MULTISPECIES: alpha/beta fold hydrolase [Nocardioides]|uniref:Alpha/beta fold hydrolase n=1 Tax=Nocardioides vastitatis TaxID=2568655 RepID=A0ABW0ZFW2_9ACTN|nr:alpha/beta fold hydrolase [Nocardioides sp.]